VDWAADEAFPLSDVVKNWGLNLNEVPVGEAAPSTDVHSPGDDLDDEVPF
jgi:hypothetical protein